MARKPKEFDPTLLIKNQKWKADTIKELMISGTNLNQPGESSPYIPFDKNHPEHPDYEPPKSQEQYDQLTLPIELANMQEFQRGGRVGLDSGVFVNNVGEAWIRMPDGQIKFDGLYNKKVHGPVFPMDQAKNNPTDGLKIAQNFSPADVPLGDGLIYEAKTKMQQNLKQKYDMMLENGMMSEEEYHKQMQRTMGTKKK